MPNDDNVAMGNLDKQNEVFVDAQFLSPGRGEIYAWQDT